MTSLLWSAVFIIVALAKFDKTAFLYNNEEIECLNKPISPKK